MNAVRHIATSTRHDGTIPGVRVRRCAARRGGFTLLELVMVLAVLAIALGVAAPSFSAFARGRKAEDAAAQFVALARWARSQAITDGAVYRIMIDEEHRQWHAVLDDGGVLSEAPGEFGQMYTADESVRIETDAPQLEGMRTISFDASGRGDPGSVRFTGSHGTVEVICQTPLDEYHVATGDETGGGR